MKESKIPSVLRSHDPRGGLVALGAVWLTSVSLLSAQATPADSAVVAPGTRYLASGLHRFLLGTNYRALWATPIKVPVIDLATIAGGLTAVEKGGGKQTQSLRLRSADGRTYVFRLFDKDPTKAWPELAKRTPARGIAEDQTSGLFPAGPLTVASLEAAAGLLHTEEQLGFMPDDPRLGQWRDEFKNRLGWLEQRIRGREDLDPFPGAAEVATTDKLFHELVRHGSNIVDERAYLKARLFDLFVGDWDRHADQWTWARFDERGMHRWEPIPRDRDWALSRLDGPAYAIVRWFMPEFQDFGGSYGSIYGLTYNAQPLDRRLLSSLDRRTWDSVVTELTDRLSDSVIAQAVGQLPAAIYQRAGRHLERDLRARRDHLGKAADRFYRQLADQIDLWGSDDPDDVRLVRGPDGELEVELRRRDRILTDRRLLPSETSELRLYLFRGADTVRFEGTGPARITVRIVTGGGSDLVVDSTGAGGVLVYDDSSSATVLGTTSIRHSRRPFHGEIDPTSPSAIHRDWGWLPGFAPRIEIGPEVGLLVGGGPVFTRFGFRKSPYQSRIMVRAAYSTGAEGFDADITGDFRFEAPSVRLGFRAATRSTAIQRFYGFGNETAVPPADRRLTHVFAQEYRFEPVLRLRFGPLGLGLGAKLQASHTDLSFPSLLAVARPYGSGNFTEAGGVVMATLDTRDQPVNPRSGLFVEARAALYPSLFDVRETFETASIEARTYLTVATLPAKPTLALRAGAARAWNDTPFFELPSLGGRSSLRGASTRRFLGDRSVHGSAELRLDLGAFSLLAPGTWGIYGLTDVGRVYLTGESSSVWHSGFGGGLWFAFIDRRSTITATYAATDEGGRIYLQAGFHY